MIVCYVLKSLGSNRTYTGVTTNIDRRLRQHNGEIKGGAKATRIGRPYKIYCVIEGFKTLGEAMSVEWYLKHKKDYLIDREKYSIYYI